MPPPIAVKLKWALICPWKGDRGWFLESVVFFFFFFLRPSPQTRWSCGVMLWLLPICCLYALHWFSLSCFWSLSMSRVNDEKGIILNFAQGKCNPRALLHWAVPFRARVPLISGSGMQEAYLHLASPVVMFIYESACVNGILRCESIEPAQDKRVLWESSS